MHKDKFKFNWFTCSISLFGFHCHVLHYLIFEKFDDIKKCYGIHQFSGNNIDEVCNLYINLYHIVIIDNSNNSIEYIQKDCFHNLYHLKYIDLSKNVIQNIESKAFNNLPELNYINFSNNQITYLPSNIIYKSFHTLTISAQHKHNKENWNKCIFHIKDSYAGTSDDRLFCFVLPDVICTAVRPWYKSRTNLLTNISIQVTFVLISLSIIITNSLSVFIHSTLFEVNRSFKKTVLAINLNDMICGIYLDYNMGCSILL